MNDQVDAIKNLSLEDKKARLREFLISQQQQKSKPSPKAKIDFKVTNIDDNVGEYTENKLDELFAQGDLEPVDSIAIAALPDTFIDNTNFTKEQLVNSIMNNEPLFFRVYDLSLGRIGQITLPIFQNELYSDPQKSMVAIKKALSMARNYGAKIAALQASLPSATRYGHTVYEAIKETPSEIKLTTGHSITVASIVMNIQIILDKSSRFLKDETLAVLGLGSIGTVALKLLLKKCEHPQKIILCDLYLKRDILEQCKQDLITEYDYRGEINIVESRDDLPREIYQASLILGATNVPNLIKVDLLQPGTLLVDDSIPHCFNPNEAFARFSLDRDILFTEGGVLRVPYEIKHLQYGPNVMEMLPNTAKIEDNIALRAFSYEQSNDEILSCTLSGLIHLNFPEVPPLLGLVSIEHGEIAYDCLTKLGIRGTRLKIIGQYLNENAILAFKKNYSAARLHQPEAPYTVIVQPPIVQSPELVEGRHSALTASADEKNEGLQQKYITYAPAPKIIWDIQQESPELYKMVEKRMGLIAADLAHFEKEIPLTKGFEAFSAYPFSRPKGELDIFYKEYANGSALAFRGGTFRVENLYDIVTGLAKASVQSEFALSNFYTNLTHQIMMESRAPLALSKYVAESEADGAEKISKAHLEGFGELINLPLPLRIYLWPPEAYEKCIALMSPFLKSAQLTALEETIRDGLALYVYYLPYMPTKMSSLAKSSAVEGVYQVKGYKDKINAIPGDSKKIVESWINLVTRLLAMGIIPCNGLLVTNQSIGQRHACLEGGFDSTLSFKEAKELDPSELFENLMITIMELTHTVKSLLLGSLATKENIFPNSGNTFSDPLTFVVSNFIATKIKKGIATYKKQGFSIEAEIEEFFDTLHHMKHVHRTLDHLFPNLVGQAKENMKKWQSMESVWS